MSGEESAATEGSADEAFQVERDIPNFSMVPVWLWDRDDVKAIDIRVYVVLWHHADRETNTCFPKIKTIAQEARSSESAVKRSLRRLAEIGAIQKRQQWKNGVPKQNLYRVHFNQPVGGGSKNEPTPGSTSERGDGSRNDPLTRTNENKNQFEPEPELVAENFDSNGSTSTPNDTERIIEWIRDEVGDLLGADKLDEIRGLIAEALEVVDAAMVVEPAAKKLIHQLQAGAIDRSPVPWFASTVTSQAAAVSGVTLDLTIGKNAAKAVDCRGCGGHHRADVDVCPGGERPDEIEAGPPPLPASRRSYYCGPCDVSHPGGCPEPDQRELASVGASDQEPF